MMPLIIQSIATIAFFFIIVSGLHFNGPVGGGLIVIPIFSCFVVGVLSVIIYSYLDSESFALLTAIGVFVMPFVEMLVFYFLYILYDWVSDKIYKNTEFYYNVSFSAPEFSPTKITALYLKKGRKKYSPLGDCHKYIIDKGLTCYCMNMYDVNDHFCPKQLFSTWVSFADRKVYTINAELPYDTLRSYFMDKKKKYGLNFCFLPDGEVRISVGDQSHKGILLDWSAKGAECKDEKVLAELCQSVNCESIDEYFDIAYPEWKNNRWRTYLQDGGSLKPIIDKCMERFNYKIFFEFIGEKFTITKYDITYSNGEHCNYDNSEHPLTELSEGVEFPSRVAAVNYIRWRTSKYEYELSMYFNETERLQIFDVNYGDDRMKKGEYKIEVRIDEGKKYVYVSDKLNVEGRDDMYESESVEFLLKRTSLKAKNDSDCWSNYKKRTNFFGL